MILEQIAEELVSMTSPLVGGRTINIMNRDGVIIASTETERIGTVHQGARQVIHTGKTVNISKNQVSRYPGAKEGCNMPLRMGDTVVGVVGIYGNPEEIQDLAHLLEVYAAKYLELETLVWQRTVENELRSKLFHLLTAWNEAEKEYAGSLMDALHLYPEPPFQVAVLSVSAALGETFLNLDCLQMLAELLVSRNLVRRGQDLYCMEENRLMILRSQAGNEKAVWEKIYLAASQVGKFRLSLGSPCDRMEQIRISWEEACGLDVCGRKQINDIQEPQARCAWMMDRTVRTQKEYLKLQYRRLSGCYRPDELHMLLDSADCYYQEGRSVSRAADRLFIHKNTLQYRLRRLLETLGLEKEPDFYQEYLMRLILQYAQTLPPEEQVKHQG